MSLTLDEATALTGSWVKSWSAKRKQIGTAKLVRVVGTDHAIIQPQNHRRFETSPLCDLSRHEKAMHQAQERVTKPEETAAPQRVLVDLKFKRWWVKGRGNTPAYWSKQVGDASVYETPEDASLAISHVRRVNDHLGAGDLTVMTLDEASLTAIKWSAMEREPANPEPEKPVESTTPAPAKPAKVEPPKPQSAVCEWVTLVELGKIARPSNPPSGISMNHWLKDGAIPKAAARMGTRPGSARQVWEANLTVLRACGWVDIQQGIDAKVAKGQLNKARISMPRWTDDLKPVWKEDGRNVPKKAAPAHEPVSIAQPAKPEPKPAPTVTTRGFTPVGDVRPDQFAKAESKAVSEPVEARCDVCAPVVPEPAAIVRPDPVRGMAEARRLSLAEAERDEAEAHAMYLEAQASRIRAAAALVYASRTGAL